MSERTLVALKGRFSSLINIGANSELFLDLGNLAKCCEAVIYSISLIDIDVNYIFQEIIQRYRK